MNLKRKISLVSFHIHSSDTSQVDDNIKYASLAMRKETRLMFDRTNG